MISDNSSHGHSPLLLLEGLQLRNDEVGATERPHIVLVSDDPVKTDEVEQDQSIAEEKRSFPDEDKADGQNGQYTGKDPVHNPRKHPSKGVR